MEKTKAWADGKKYHIFWSKFESFLNLTDLQFVPYRFQFFHYHTFSVRTWSKVHTHKSFVFLTDFWGSTRASRCWGQMCLFLLFEDFVFVEAVVEDKVGKSVVEVGSESHDAVVFVWVRQLLEEDICLLQRPGQHHTLLVVHIVIWKNSVKISIRDCIP